MVVTLTARHFRDLTRATEATTVAALAAELGSDFTDEGLREAPFLLIGEGTSEIQKLIISKGVLRDYRS